MSTKTITTGDMLGIREEQLQFMDGLKTYPSSHVRRDPLELMARITAHMELLTQLEGTKPVVTLHGGFKAHTTNQHRILAAAMIEKYIKSGCKSLDRYAKRFKPKD